LADDEGTTDHHFLKSSTLVKRRRVKDSVTLPKPEELVHVQELSADSDLRVEGNKSPSFKAAQKGKDLAVALLESLMDGCKWDPHDCVLVVDWTPYAGDFSRGVREFQIKMGQATGTWHYMGVGVNAACKTIEYPKRRMEQDLAAQWLQGALELAKVLPGGSTEVVKPELTPPPPTEEELAAVPGASTAYKGMSQVKWNVLKQQGTSMVIDSAWQQEFKEAPPAVAELFETLREKHVKEYENLLQGCMAADPGDSDTVIDSRAGADNEAKFKAPSSTDPGIIEYESVGQLEANVKIILKMKSAEKGVELLIDEAGNYYLCAIADKTLRRGVHLGSFGGGSLAPRDETVSRVVEWSLPDGDKTWVSLLKSTEGGDDDTAKKAVKTTSGTLYSIIQGLEAKGHMDVSLTVFREGGASR